MPLIVATYVCHATRAAHAVCSNKHESEKSYLSNSYPLGVIATAKTTIIQVFTESLKKLSSSLYCTLCSNGCSLFLCTGTKKCWVPNKITKKVFNASIYMAQQKRFQKNSLCFKENLHCSSSML